MAKQSVSKAVNNEQVYVVERILGKRKRRGKIEFLIKWKYFDQ